MSLNIHVNNWIKSNFAIIKLYEESDLLPPGEERIMVDTQIESIQSEIYASECSLADEAPGVHDLAEKLRIAISRARDSDGDPIADAAKCCVEWRLVASVLRGLEMMAARDTLLLAD